MAAGAVSAHAHAAPAVLGLNRAAPRSRAQPWSPLLLPGGEHGARGCRCRRSGTRRRGRRPGLPEGRPRGWGAVRCARPLSPRRRSSRPVLPPVPLRGRGAFLPALQCSRSRLGFPSLKSLQGSVGGCLRPPPGAAAARAGRALFGAALQPSPARLGLARGERLGLGSNPGCSRGSTFAQLPDSPSSRLFFRARMQCLLDAAFYFFF